MTQMFAELLILIPSTLFSGYVIFVTTVLQMVMNALDEATFRRFVLLLVKKAPKSVYVYISSSTTLVAMTSCSMVSTTGGL